MGPELVVAGEVDSYGRISLNPGHSSSDHEQPRLRGKEVSHGYHPQHGYGCNHARAHDKQNMQLLSAQMRMLSDSNGHVPASVIADGLAGITVHEVGHALGLRHNFKASGNIPYAQIYNGSYTKTHGGSASVMD